MTPRIRVPAASPSKYRITRGLNPPVRLGSSKIRGRGDEILCAGRQFSNLLGGQSTVFGIDVSEAARFAIRQQGLMQAAHSDGRARRRRSTSVPCEDRKTRWPRRTAARQISPAEIAASAPPSPRGKRQSKDRDVRAVATSPILVNEGFHASRTKLDRRAPRFRYEAR